MDLQTLFHQISPGLTLYAVLVTFGALCIRLARVFNDRERECQREYLDKLKNLQDAFRIRTVEPVIGRVLEESINAAYDKACSSLLAKTRGPNNQPLNQQELIQAVSEESITQLSVELKRGERTATAFLSSRQGTQFLDELNALYSRIGSMTVHYERIKHFSRVAYSFLFVLGLLFFLGLIKLLLATVQTSLLIIYGYAILLCVFWAIYGIVQLSRYEKNLHDVIDRMTLYPESHP